MRTGDGGHHERVADDDQNVDEDEDGQQQDLARLGPLDRGNQAVALGRIHLGRCSAAVRFRRTTVSDDQPLPTLPVLVAAGDHLQEEERKREKENTINRSE